VREPSLHYYRKSSFPVLFCLKGVLEWFDYCLKFKHGKQQFDFLQRLAFWTFFRFRRVGLDFNISNILVCRPLDKELKLNGTHFETKVSHISFVERWAYYTFFILCQKIRLDMTFIRKNSKHVIIIIRFRNVKAPRLQGTVSTECPWDSFQSRRPFYMIFGLIWIK